mmetsp:Transcript_11641/g.33507  ORF Transcript_11641/g.33507 Transcript_11641/m.33507 type:complete len:106 (-) Transcript_11641:406-723(-)
MLLPPLHRDERRGGIREKYLPRTAPLESVGVGGVGSSRFDQTEIVRDDDDDCDDCDEKGTKKKDGGRDGNDDGHDGFPKPGPTTDDSIAGPEAGTNTGVGFLPRG